MELTTRLAARLTHEFRGLLGTGGAFTVFFFDKLFVQAASFEGDAVLVEMTGDGFLPAHRRLSAAQHDAMLRLGFTRPDSEMPNWWIGVEDGHERALYRAARAAVTALIEIHGVPVEALTEQLPLAWVSPYPPRPPEPPAAPAADTPDNAAVLRSFLPGVPELKALALRLALAENYALTCISTGTIYHHDELARAAWDLSKAEGAPRASDVVGWDHSARLWAATAAVDAYWFSHSADTSSELRTDQEETWRAIQTWVRLSPWKDDFDFDLTPTWRRELQIQRVYEM